ncbi:cilia- and flagella-associated protein 57 [Prionailurus bengalensis]|uniref:cilia- and flagella-associated protein 57 n=1 Tax=Prionailurus bengalensis TaxID=37029 RepID=UPI001CA9BB2F|nr:cilia- and flagella-associated protein 57 [Prionailurus bengalensis]XP_043430576.1 cilia- and flagella-associated protein 57 [Prionailurus bengalensis]
MSQRTCTSALVEGAGWPEARAAGKGRLSLLLPAPRPLLARRGPTWTRAPPTPTAGCLGRTFPPGLPLPAAYPHFRFAVAIGTAPASERAGLLGTHRSSTPGYTRGLVTQREDAKANSLPGTMSTVVAQSLHVFGLRSHVANNIFFFDEQIIIFPSGNHCVKYNVDQKWQKFIPGSDKSQGMLALSISPNRRYLAISEIVQEKPVITIYELSSIPCRKRKILNNFDFPVQRFISMAFSPDSKYLLTQTSPPESNLVYWLWEKQKVMAIIRTDFQNNAVYQVSFNPQDNTQVCVTGNGMFKLLRFAEGTLKQTNFQRGEPQNYLAHTWVSEDKIIVGTDTGRLFLFESGDQRWETSIMVKEPTSETRNLEVIRESESLIEFPPISSPVPSYEQVMMASNNSQLAMPQVFAIAAYSKGFACAAGPGRVLLFEKMEEKDIYRESREIRIPTDPQSNERSQPDKQDILCMCFSPSEETLVVSTSKNQLYSITMSLTEISKGEPAHFEYLMYPLHSAAITGLATCIRKPFIATCSLDRSVRIWNYESNTLELFKEYQEEAYTISLHPSGHFVVVGFADKLRLMNLLIDDIRSFKEYSVRGCRECSFSNGGHLFAAVSGNVIHIFATTSLENISNLKGHTGKVRSVAWNADDSKLISCGTDGAVYEWNLSSGKRETECVLKSCSYNCVTVSPDAKIIFAVGSDQTLKEIADSSILREISAFDVVYTAIVISHSGRMMFVGTSVGTIRAMKYPLPLQKEFNEYQAHAGPITKMLLTFDDQFLLTVAEDGCLFTWKVFDKDGRGIKREREVGFAEEVLITKTDMEEKAQIMLELKTRVEELKMENEYQLRLKDMNYSEKIKELTDKFLQEMESLKTKNQVLKTEKEKQDVFHRERIDDLLDKQSQELQDLECCNNQKLLLEYEKYQELQLKSQRMQEEYEKQLRDNDETKSQALEELTEFYEAKLQEKTTLLEEAQEDVRQQLREFEETKKQIEEDEDREIQDIKTKYEKKLRDEKESNLRLKGETGIMRKKFSSLQKEVEERTNDIESLKREQVKLQGVIKSLEKDILGLKREIQERDETIQDKEKRIYDLKKKNQELEKFKFVLDYKIKELKKQIEPREDEIKVMKEQIQEMEAELERFHKQNTQLELNITELWQKLRATDQEMRRERQKERDLEALVRRFKTDLHNCVAYIQEPRLLKEKVRALFEKYVQRADMVEIAGLNTDLQQEYARQREHLERNLATLRKKVVKESELRRTDYVRIMQENVSLIKEINELRRELKFTRSQVYDLEAALKLTKKIRPQDVPETVPSEAMPSIAPTMRLNEQEETGRIIEMQRLEIQRLREQIQEQEQIPGFHPLSVVRLPSLLESEVDFEVQTK